MPIHDSIKKSFFLKFLLITIFIGNLYVGMQCLFHLFGEHFLDFYFRWYAFQAPRFNNAILLIGAIVTVLGAFKIWSNGIAGFSLYVAGKGIVLLGYIVLTMMEYKISELAYPWVLIPILIGMEAIYPFVLYLSLPKDKVRRSF